MDKPKFAFVHRHTPSAHPTIPITHAASFILLIFFIRTIFLRENIAFICLITDSARGLYHKRPAVKRAIPFFCLLTM